MIPIWNKIRVVKRLPLTSLFPISLLLIILSTLSCNSSSAGAPNKKSGDNSGKAGKPTEVHLTPATETTMARTIVVLGTLAADDKVTVSAKVPGRLASISIDLGSAVKKGQLIAQIETKDYELRIEQATSALAQARTLLGLSAEGIDDQVNIEETGRVIEARATLEESRLNLQRIQALVDQGVVAKAQLDSANASFVRAQSAYQNAREEARNRQALVRQRRSELMLARQQLADTAIYAPIDGIIESRISTTGEYLNAGTAIANIVKINPLRLRAEIPERDASSVKVGQAVRINLAGERQTYTGQIARLSPSLTEQNRSLMIEAEIVNPGGLKPGGFAQAEIVVDGDNKVLAVPPTAIITFAGIEKVITVKDGKAVEKQIKTGRRNEQWIEVLSGLVANESVVNKPGNLQQGQAVVVGE